MNLTDNMKAKDISRVIEEFAPLSRQEEWDNSGFCIGSPEQEVHKVLVGFDCTPALIQEAVEVGADMVVTHHPLIFKGLKKIDPDTFGGSIVYGAIRNGIVVYSAHTNADKVIEGVSGLMASRIGLEDVELLDPDGLGVVGNLPDPMGGEEFVKFIKERFGLKALRCSAPVESVSRVAMCGGAGSSLIGMARQAGAEAYICGDVSYHNFFAENNFMVMDIGHFESEYDIVEKISSLLKEKLNTFAVQITRNNNNPVYYY